MPLSRRQGALLGRDDPGGAVRRAQVFGQPTSSGIQKDGGRPKQWITPGAPPITIAPYRGTRYETLVPDTLDVAEMARLAIGGLTGPLDPADDYSLYWIVGYHNYPPVMRKEECPHIQTKFMGALPLMRISTGSSVNDHVDLAWMNSIAANRGGAR